MSLKNFVNAGSINSILAGYAKVKVDYLPLNIFLPDTNLLKQDCIAAIGDSKRPYSVSADDTKSYLAVASLMHCFDGWNYLSSSVDSLIKGEKFISIHLSYYAELRAAMSFMATEGIGIFDHNHICISNANAIARNPNLGKRNGTHTFVWETLSTWIKNKSNINTLKYFSLHGKTFEEWVGHVPGGSVLPVISLIVKDWLKTWSFDVKNYKKDRASRNTFSYRPTRISQLNPDNLHGKLTELSQFWQLLEPTGSDRFELLDKYLFKSLFTEIHKVLVKNGNTIAIEKLLEDTFIAAKVPPDAQLQKILSSTTSHILLAHSQDKSIDSVGHAKPLAVIARAILMLRLASGATSFLLKTAGITKQELEFYWRTVGADYGFWEPAQTPASFVELWDLVYDAIVEIDDWTAKTPPQNLSNLYERNGGDLQIYSQFNRAAFWGTGY